MESRPRGKNVPVTPQATLPGRGMQPREEQALDLRRPLCASRARSPCARSCGSWARAPRASSCTVKERSAHEGNPRGHTVPTPALQRAFYWVTLFRAAACAALESHRRGGVVVPEAKARR